MEDIIEFVELYNGEIIIGLFSVVLVLFILYLISQARISKWKRRYEVLVKGSDGSNIEGIMLKNNEDIEVLKQELKIANKKIDNLNMKLTFAIQKVGFIRYNAFADMGSELSFSIVFLDNFHNGFILTSIYSREQSATYAKPIRDGKSTYSLSAEEIQAVDRAIKGERDIDIY